MTNENAKDVKTGLAVDTTSGDVYRVVGEKFPEDVLVSIGTPLEEWDNSAQKQKNFPNEVVITP